MLGFQQQQQQQQQQNCHEILTEIWACIVSQPNLCYVCWVKIRNKIVFMSVQSLSIMQMLMKTWVYDCCQNESPVFAVGHPDPNRHDKFGPM
jgi:hypothetical protein